MCEKAILRKCSRRWRLMTAFRLRRNERLETLLIYKSEWKKLQRRTKPRRENFLLNWKKLRIRNKRLKLLIRRVNTQSSNLKKKNNKTLAALKKSSLPRM
jgi:hypothetical protein